MVNPSPGIVIVHATHSAKLTTADSQRYLAGKRISFSADLGMDSFELMLASISRFNCQSNHVGKVYLTDTLNWSL